MTANAASGLKRFQGSCEPLAPIDVTNLVEWITGLNREWIKGADRPLVEIDPLFLQHHTDRVVDELMGYFPGCRDKYRSITAINPGDYVGWHTDQVLNDAGWITRIHVPIISNPEAWFMTDCIAHNLKVGMSYLVNPVRPHSVSNFGSKPRVHLMFDVIRDE